MIQLVKNDYFIYCKESHIENNRSFYGSFSLGPFNPGQSITIANALRRTLLSELKGLAITSVEIEGIFHEYSTLPGIKDSILDILLNLKDIVLKSKNYGNKKKNFSYSSIFKTEQIGYLKTKGPGIVTASDIKFPPGIQCVDPSQYIATLSEIGVLTLKIKINESQKYVPAILDFSLSSACAAALPLQDTGKKNSLFNSQKKTNEKKKGPKLQLPFLFRGLAKQGAKGVPYYNYSMEGAEKARPESLLCKMQSKKIFNEQKNVMNFFKANFFYNKNFRSHLTKKEFNFCYKEDNKNNNKNLRGVTLLPIFQKKIGNKTFGRKEKEKKKYFFFNNKFPLMQSIGGMPLQPSVGEVQLQDRNKKNIKYLWLKKIKTIQFKLKLKHQQLKKKGWKLNKDSYFNNLPFGVQEQTAGFKATPLVIDAVFMPINKVNYIIEKHDQFNFATKEKKEHSYFFFKIKSFNKKISSRKKLLYKTSFLKFLRLQQYNTKKKNQIASSVSFTLNTTKGLSINKKTENVKKKNTSFREAFSFPFLFFFSKIIPFFFPPKVFPTGKTERGSREKRKTPFPFFSKKKKYKPSSEAKLSFAAPPYFSASPLFLFFLPFCKHKGGKKPQALPFSLAKLNGSFSVFPSLTRKKGREKPTSRITKLSLASLHFSGFFSLRKKKHKSYNFAWLSKIVIFLAKQKKLRAENAGQKTKEPRQKAQAESLSLDKLNGTRPNQRLGRKGWGGKVVGPEGGKKTVFFLAKQGKTQLDSLKVLSFLPEKQRQKKSCKAEKKAPVIFQKKIRSKEGLPDSFAPKKRPNLNFFSLQSKNKINISFAKQKNSYFLYSKKKKIKTTLKNNIILEIWTNGSIHPRQALYDACKHLVSLFSKLEKAKSIQSVFQTEKTYLKKQPKPLWSLLNLTELNKNIPAALFPVSTPRGSKEKYTPLLASHGSLFRFPYKACLPLPFDFLRTAASQARSLSPRPLGGGVLLSLAKLSSSACAFFPPPMQGIGGGKKVAKQGGTALASQPLRRKGRNVVGSSAFIFPCEASSPPRLCVQSLGSGFAYSLRAQHGGKSETREKATGVCDSGIQSLQSFVETIRLLGVPKGTPRTRRNNPKKKKQPLSLFAALLFSFSQWEKEKSMQQEGKKQALFRSLLALQDAKGTENRNEAKRGKERKKKRRVRNKNYKLLWAIVFLKKYFNALHFFVYNQKIKKQSKQTQTEFKKDSIKLMLNFISFKPKRIILKATFKNGFYLAKVNTYNHYTVKPFTM